MNQFLISRGSFSEIQDRRLPRGRGIFVIVAMVAMILGASPVVASGIPVYDAAADANEKTSFGTYVKDKLLEFKNWVMQLDFLRNAYETATKTFQKASDLVRQGRETLRIIGDPVGMMMSLGFGEVASLVSDVKGVVDEGMNLFKWGVGVTEMVKAAGRGDIQAMASLGEEIGIDGRWGNLANIRTPQDALWAIEQFEGHGRQRAKYAALEEARGPEAQQAVHRGELMAQFEQTIQKLGSARDQTEIAGLTARAQGLADSIGMMSDQETRDAMNYLVDNAALETALDAGERAEGLDRAMRHFESVRQENERLIGRYAAARHYSGQASLSGADLYSGTHLSDPGQDRRPDVEVYQGGSASGGYASSFGTGRESAIQARLNSLGSTSLKLCGRYSRETIELATGQTLARHNSAKNYGSSLVAIGYRPISDSGKFINGDTRIFQNSGHGHMEVFYNGKWYSDHKQSSDSTHRMGVGRRYTTQQLYRYDGPQMVSN